jgi:hypothetical protein
MSVQNKINVFVRHSRLSTVIIHTNNNWLNTVLDLKDIKEIGNKMLVNWTS